MNGTAFALLCGLFSVAACSAPRESAATRAALRFEQTPCFGPCAVFVLDVSEAGNGTLTVRKPFLEGPLVHIEAGVYRGKVSKELTSAVMQAAEQVQFETLEARYDNPRIMDLPSTLYTVGTHSVEQRYGGPDLSALKASFYRLLEATEWMPVASTTEH